MASKHDRITCSTIQRNKNWVPLFFLVNVCFLRCNSSQPQTFVQKRSHLPLLRVSWAEMQLSELLVDGTTQDLPILQTAQHQSRERRSVRNLACWTKIKSRVGNFAKVIQLSQCWPSPIFGQHKLCKTQLVSKTKFTDSVVGSESCKSTH